MKTGALILCSQPVSVAEPMGQITDLQRLIMTFQQANVHPIVVVAESAVGIEREIARLGAVLLTGTGDAGQAGFAQVGLAYLADQCSRVFVALSHISLFCGDTLAQLGQSRRKMAVPVYQGQRGYPLLLDRQVFGAVTGSGVSLMDAVVESDYKLETVPVSDPGVLVESGCHSAAPAYRELVRSHPLNRLRPVVKVRLAKERMFLGPGSHQLLLLIHKTGSVRLACQQMGMSYSKAWNVVNNMEEQLGYQVLARKQGGRGGGETHLTPQGLELAERYGSFQQQCVQAVQNLFDQHFPREGE